MKKLKVSITTVVAIMLVSVLIGEMFFNSLLTNNTLSIAFASSASSVTYDPWGQKGVLNYLFWTADEKLEQDVKMLQNDLGLDDSTMAKLKELGLEEYQNISKFIVGDNLSKTKADVFNNAWNNNFKEIDSKTQALLGDKYEAFREWIRNWWSEETEYREKWVTEKMEGTL